MMRGDSVGEKQRGRGGRARGAWVGCALEISFGIATPIVLIILLSVSSCISKPSQIAKNETPTAPLSTVPVYESTWNTSEIYFEVLVSPPSKVKVNGVLQP